LEGNSNLPKENTKINYKIGQIEHKTIQSTKEMLRNDAKTMYLVYER